MLCSQCGICCKLFLINLTKEEYESKRYKTQFDEFGLVEDFEEAELCAANIITQKKDGSCVYLKHGKCSIHGIRPASCRKFFCTSKNPSFKTMIQKIKDYKSSPEMTKKELAEARAEIKAGKTHTLSKVKKELKL